MKVNRIVRVLCAMMALLIVLGVPEFALAADGAVAKAAKPVSVALNYSEKTILPGEMLRLVATVEPADAAQSVTWKSSKTSVATVNSKGLVTAKAAGSATITATTKKGGKKATCVVTVSKLFDGVNVRFYGIGNTNYVSAGRLSACAEDLKSMASLYGLASFGGKPVNVNPYYDQTGAGIRSVLNGMVSNPAITENDVTIFYYTGHGIQSKDPTYHGALIGIDYSTYNQQSLVTVDEVQSYLDRVKGHVIVILDSCYSGQFIKSKGGEDNASFISAAKAANQAWVSRLSASGATNYNSKALTGSSVKTKYRLLVASSNAQTSTALSDSYTGESFSLFTWKLEEKLANMAADSNNDRIVTLKEVYTSVNKAVSSFKSQWNRYYPKNKIVQVTQVWPSGNVFPMYARN